MILHMTMLLKILALTTRLIIRIGYSAALSFIGIMLIVFILPRQIITTFALATMMMAFS